MKILMVCLGNICRSPIAEGILKHKAKLSGFAWKVDSAGTGAWHTGEMPDPRSIATAQKYGIDITDQRARQLHSSDLTEFDLILTMDKNNYQNALALAKADEQKEKVKMIMDFVYPDTSVSVPDPYWNDDGFEHVFRMLEEACERIIDRFGENSTEK